MRTNRAVTVLAASLALVLGVPPARGLAAPAPADPRIPLVHSPSNNCERGADALPGTGTPSRGFTVVATTAQGRIGAAVLLRDATPDATYAVYLIQSDGDLAGDPLD